MLYSICCCIMLYMVNRLQHVVMTCDSTQALDPLPGGHRYLHVRKCMAGSWSGWVPGLRPWQQDESEAGRPGSVSHAGIKASHILKHPQTSSNHPQTSSNILKYLQISLNSNIMRLCSWSRKSHIKDSEVGENRKAEANIDITCS